MPEALNTLAVSWRDGASLQGSGMVVSWRDGSSVYGTGGAYTPHSPPAGSTSGSPQPAAVGARIAAGASYIVAHTVTVIDERDETEVDVTGVTISTDADSFMWALKATGGESLRAKLLAGEQPAVLRVTIDGDPWRFVVDSVSRERAHPASKVTVTGRSGTVIAAAPYEGDRTWTNDEVTTAAQIAGVANLYTGLEVSWEIDDWIIPARVFNFTTTPLGVVKAVADAAGAIVVSDKYDLSVRVLPRYAFMPNEWAAVTPDVELPIGCIATDAFERADQPAYNAVPLSGQQQGVTATVRLAGTDGGNPAPLVTDLLLTENIVLQMRGLSILGASGEQARVTLRVPVLYGTGQPGVLGIGQLVRVVDTDETWHGVVRSVSVDVAMPSVYQTVVLERHTRDIDGTVIAPAVLNPLVFSGTIPAQTWTTGTGVSLNLASYWSGGATPYAWSMRAGALPAGLALNPATGVISGTPTASGSFSYAVRAVDSIANMADSNAFAISVAAALVFTGTVPAQSGTAGTAYSTLSLASYFSGGATPYAYSVLSGTLPAGLSLNSSTGQVTGTPTAAGSATIVFRVTDAAARTASTNSVSYAVLAAAPTFSGTIGAQSLTVGTAFSLDISTFFANGTTPLAYSVFSGTLPAGISLNSSTGVISGTPTTTASAVALVFRATDASSRTVNSNSANFTVASGAATDPLWTNVWMRLPLDTSIADVSNNALPTAVIACTTSGTNASAGLQTTAAKFGTKGWLAVRSDSANTASVIESDLTSLGSTVRTWGTQDWCVEGWIAVGDNTGPSGTRQRRWYAFYQSTRGLIISTIAPGQISVQLSASTATLPFTSATTGTISSSQALSATGVIADNAFHHIAVVRNGSNFRIYLDGVVVHESTISITMPAIDRVWVGGVNNSLAAFGVISCTSGASGSPANDKLDDWRVTLGNARYTAAFTPPTAALPTS